MSAKAEKDALMNRLRVQKHREKKRLKLEESPQSSTEENTSLIGESKSESSSDDLSQIQTLSDNSEVIEAQNSGVNQSLDSFTSTNSLLGSATGDTNELHCNYGTSDNEDYSQLSAAECLESKSVDGKKIYTRIRQWASKEVPYYKTDSLLEILHEYLPDLSLCHKTLLKTSLHLSRRIKKFNVCDPSDTSEYVYFGIAIHLQKIVNVLLHIGNILWLIIFVDGMTPYKSSPLNFWPILGLVFHQSATYKPFVIGAYHGKGKPFSVDLYVEDLVIELNHLLKEGITIKGKKFEVRIKCFCCDKPARSYLKCVVNHGAYFACERCWVVGIHHLNRIVYPLRDCQQKTEESFRNQENPEHHDGVSPLLKLRDKDDKPLKLVKLFIQEFMHAGSLGIMKKLMTEQWFSDDSKITREKRIKVSLRLVNLVSQVPSEFDRTTRELNNLSLWKAKEYRLMLLFISPFVLDGVLSAEEYSHLLLLFVACRILCSRELFKKFGDQAKVYLDRFVLLSELIYGSEFVVLVPHILSHLYEDAKNMDCPISDLDAFIFEGYLSELKRALRSGNRPLAQICKKVEIDLEINPRVAVSTLDLRILDHKKSENLYHVQKLKYLNFELTPNKPNNVVLMRDGSIVEIQDLICYTEGVDATQLYLLGKKLEITGSAFNYPIPSSALQIYAVKRKHECDIVKYPLSEMSCKVMLCEIYELSCDEKKLISIPMLPMSGN